MAGSLLRALRATFLRRRSITISHARRMIRLRVETLEARLLLHGAGTLGDEHEAVMQLIEFESIHNPNFQQLHNITPATSPFSATNDFYQAVDVDIAPDGNYYWSDVDNWLKETYDPITDSFIATAAEHLPTTGDDVSIPAGVNLTYDLGPDAFKTFAAPPADPTLVASVKNNLRLHTIGVDGAPTFKANTELLMYFETMVVTPAGSLTINNTDPTHTVRLVIAAPDWSKFSLAQPFDPNLDPLEFARGLISHGTVNMTGEMVTPYITLPQLTRAASNVPADANNNVILPTTKTVTTSTGGTRQVVVPPPAPNAFQFTIAAGVATTGWTVGDRIVVTGTDPYKVNPSTGASSDEEAVIAAIKPNNDGSTTIIAKVQVAVLQSTDLLAPPTAIKMVGALQYDHVPAADGNGASLGVEISDLTRNINIQSEDPYHTMARGHTMFMHNANVNISGVGFLGLGRSDKRTVVDDVQFYTQEIVDAINQAGMLNDPNHVPITGKNAAGEFIPIPGTGLNPRGRYAVHFHRAGVDETDGTDPSHPLLKATAPAVVQDSVVVDSPGWGYVNHSSYVNFDNNVAFNVIGASFVTEAGNELGRFTGNLAIKGVGANTGEGIESRKVKQDFGFQGDGFWFQGASIQVDNNIAVSQHHDGFVFFTQPLVQNYKWLSPSATDANNIASARQAASTMTDLLAAYATLNPGGPMYDPAVIAAFGGLGKSVDPGNVPILSFKNNTAVGDGTGMETWFHQLGSPLKASDPAQRALGSQIVGLRVGNTGGTGMFDPYTNLLTVKDTQLIGNPNYPGGTGMGRNDVTANLTYDNVNIRGFGLGVAIPVNGLDIVSGGTFQNKRNFEITTANSQTRTVLLNDKIDASGAVVSPITFLALPKAADEAARINIDLRTSYNPKQRDLSKLFNPDIIRMGTVWLNSFALGIDPADGPKQLYYYQQAANFKPFPANDDLGNPINYGGPVKDAFGNIVDYSGIEVPAELLDKTNAELMAAYGLSIGGTVAPAGAVDGKGTYSFTTPGGTTITASPRINGLIGAPSTYQASLDATSARYTKNVDATGLNPQYIFSYRFAKPNPTGEPTNVYVTVKVGSFGPAAGFPDAPYNAAAFPVRLTTLTVNGTAVTIPQPVNPPTLPTPPTLQPLIVAPPGGTLTAEQKTANYNISKANSAATAKYNSDLKAYNTYWTNYYNSPVKLSLREGWNIVSGDLDGTGKSRTQLIYGDITPPDLNLTAPDQFQLRRLTTAADPWTPGTWDSTSQTMMGVALGSTDLTPKAATVTGQFVAVMHPDDLSFGFDLKGQVVDNSFGHKSFEVFISNLKSYLNPNDPSAPGSLVPYLTQPTDDTGAPLPNYANITNYQTLKDGTNATTVVQHLQTIFFAVKDNAGNSKTFALTIYLDPAAPRVGGSANPSGSVTPSASMIALANQAYVIDLETFLMISLTDPKKK